MVVVLLRHRLLLLMKTQQSHACRLTPSLASH